MKHESLFDALSRSVGDAIADIREKIVEEGFWGRVVNERDGPNAQPIVAWPQAQMMQPEAGDHQHNGKEDMDIDR